ncbi:A24 family peptidase [Lysobacter sp. BMK333-48F3]|uniref:prepilin peptidase n=1 Tax=Lysobacter sp. BMK333-48F3 TaxID=2867962 RepID=UPI001C8C2711|nr:A24 family peptidase [Lysobacter sp. BMK333-48F3]MBX9400036.1 A24 family peptidase [Lysobacter sp. BMK333-48F3]
MAFLDQNPGLGYPLVAGFGLLLGSFYNVVILRLPKRLVWEWKKDAREVLELPEVYDPPPPGIAVERSHCPHCKRQLSWYENIPLFSYLALRGRCRTCKTPISIQYPAVELLTMLVMLACVACFGFGWQGFGAMVFTSFLIILSGIDLRTQYLPDSLTLPLMWLGIIAASDNLYFPLKPSVLGAIAGFAALWLAGELHRQYQIVVKRVKVPEVGMAPGDMKLLAAIGAWVGLKGVLPVILLSSAVGAVFGSLWLLSKGQSLKIHIPFGPYLAIAGAIVFFSGDSLLQAYLRFSGLA